MHELKPAVPVRSPRQVERPHRRRGEAERVHRRAEVVHEPGKRQLLAAQAAAGLLGRFEHEHPQPSFGERDRGDESVRPGADDDGVDLGGGGRSHEADCAA